MLKKPKNKGEPRMHNVHSIHYLHTGNACYTPLKTGSGLKCSGDQFDFVVPWQKNKGGKKASLTDSLYV